MKKTLLVVLTVAVLAGVTVVADRAWLKSSKAPAKAAKLPDAPNVVFQDLDGKESSLAEYRGKVVLINFWATWCEPCRIEIPWMIEFQQKYGGRGFTVVGVAMDDEGKHVVEPFLQKERFDVGGNLMAINYPIVLGSGDVAARVGGLIGIPTSLLISRDGKIVKRFIGLVNHDSLVKEIEGLL